MNSCLNFRPPWRDVDGRARAWPPGPREAEGWRVYLEQYPDIAPAVERAGRVADSVRGHEQEERPSDGSKPRERSTIGRRTELAAGPRAGCGDRDGGDPARSREGEEPPCGDGGDRGVTRRGEPQREAREAGPQSGLRRGPDGLAEVLVLRVDRLRLLGNGIVPYQLARALRILAARNPAVEAALIGE